jgi:YesN/AraC family two-component response regulator
MAETGKVAFEMYQARKYDLVLMDVRCPLWMDILPPG